MTDTVNVPRERIKAFLSAWVSRSGNGDIIYGMGVEDDVLELTVSDLRLLLAAAPKAEPVSDPYKFEGDDAYLLVKRDLYYRPNANGYTGIKDNAGRYTKADAERHADPMSGVSMVLADEATEFSAACFDDLALAHLQKKLDEARSELAAIRTQPEAPKVEQEPVAWLITNKASGVKDLSFRKLADFPFNHSRFEAEPLYAHHAPFSGELYEALVDLASWFTQPLQGLDGQVWAIPAGERGADEALENSRNLIAKHKTHPAPASDELLEATGGKAVIRNGQIVISIDVDALPIILSGSIALNAVSGTFKVTDADVFAQEVCIALNDEKEDGTTRVHMMFDSAFDHAIDQGAEGVEEITEDEFEDEASRLQELAKHKGAQS